MKLIFTLGLLCLTRAEWTDYDGCGRSSVSDAGAERSRIVGGWETSEHEYPYQTSLKDITGDFFCGGSIIDNIRVLTAAHCTFGMTSAMIRVGLGEHRLSSGSEYRLATVSNIRQHENFDPALMVNDVSVLTLNDDIDINYARNPVCPSERSGDADSYDGQRLIVSGWGTTTEGGSTSQNLMATAVEGFTLSDCRDFSMYPPDSILPTMMCAGLVEGGRDACQGDSGGPLVYQRSNGNFEEVGIVSWGNGCARAGWPGVYADAVYFKDWIN